MDSNKSNLPPWIGIAIGIIIYVCIIFVILLVNELMYLNVPISMTIGTLQSYLVKLFRKTNSLWYLLIATLLLIVQYIYVLASLNPGWVVEGTIPLVFIVSLAVYTLDPSAGPNAKKAYWIVSVLSNIILISLTIAKALRLPILPW